jgi:acid stress-induced BolA-like protein IbaG/YrbA
MPANPELVQRVKKALIEEFGPLARIELTDGYHDHIYALVIADHFAGLMEYQRQDLVWEALRKHLTDGEIVKVSLTLAFSPQEPEARHALEEFGLAS